MQPAASEIAIIGGGVSGSLVAIQLMRSAAAPLNIHLIERSGIYGRGVAYGTNEYSALLNVPAAKMSAFPDDPKHFLRWLHAVDFRDVQGEAAAENSFVPRCVYGDYICDVLETTGQTACSCVRLIRHDDTAIDIDGNTVYLESGNVINADKVVLAFGNFPPRELPIRMTDDYPHNRCIPNPWSGQGLAAISSDDTVLIVGTGLTMVDTVLSLQAQGHQGHILAVSKHGLLPQPHHFSSSTAVPFTLDNLPNTARQLVRLIRQHIAANPSNWRVTLDALRGITPALWQRLPVDEKRRLLRHVHPYWEVHRHRMPPHAAALIDALIESRQLIIRKGRVTGIEAHQKGFCADVQSANDTWSVEAHHVINCTGPNTRYATLADPLLDNLLQRGVVRQDCLQLGLDADGNGALRDVTGQVSTMLYTIGPTLKGALWEATAVPEIRQQAVVLAANILKPIAAEAVNGEPN